MPYKDPEKKKNTKKNTIKIIKNTGKNTEKIIKNTKKNTVKQNKVLNYIELARGNTMEYPWIMILI